MRSSTCVAPRTHLNPGALGLLGVQPPPQLLHLGSQSARGGLAAGHERLTLGAVVLGQAALLLQGQLARVKLRDGEWGGRAPREGMKGRGP